MRHDFSAQFLRVNPPDTSFGDAWESLCFALTFEETRDRSLVRLSPPDRGVDFLSRSSRKAYQCKSDERGASGSLNAQSSVESLKSAAKAKRALVWDTYFFATNAPYTGVAHENILQEARTLALADTDIEFLGPEHWDRLCRQFPSVAEERLDYRVTLTEARVIEALKSAGYFDRFVEQAKSKMVESPETLTVTNNRTPLEITVPFSKDLTIEMLLDVVRETLGVSLEWKNYPDTKTSCGPSVSITVDRVPQTLRTKLGDLAPEDLRKFSLSGRTRPRASVQHRKCRWTGCTTCTAGASWTEPHFQSRSAGN